MRLRRNRVVMAILFAITLLLGVAALAISWRLQQEREITEEKAAAAVFANRLCQPTAIGPFGPGLHICYTKFEGANNIVQRVCSPSAFAEGAISSAHFAFNNTSNYRRDNNDYTCSVPIPCTTQQLDTEGVGAEVITYGPNPNSQYCIQSPAPGGPVTCTGGEENTWDYSQCTTCDGNLLDEGNVSWSQQGGQITAAVNHVDARDLDVYLSEGNYQQFQGLMVRVRLEREEAGTYTTVDENEGYGTCTNETITRRVWSNGLLTGDTWVKYNYWLLANKDEDLTLCCNDQFCGECPQNLRGFDGTKIYDVKTRLNTKELGYDVQNATSWRDAGVTCSRRNIPTLVDANPPAAATNYRVTAEVVPQGNWLLRTQAVTSNTCASIYAYEPQPDISCVSKTPNTAEQIEIGDTVTYTVTYTVENGTVESVTLVDDFDEASLTIDTATATSGYNCTVSAGRLICEYAPAGGVTGTQTLSYTATATASGEAENGILSITGTFGEQTTEWTPGEANPCASSVFVGVPPQPNAACVNKRMFTVANGAETEVTSTTEIDPGEQVRFRISYSNGPVAATATAPITITDNVPNGYETVTTTTTGCTVSGNNVTCTLTNVPVNGTGEIVINAAASTNIRNLQTTNTATVSISGDTNPADNSPAACTVGPEIAEANAVCVSKIVSPEGPVNPGDIVSYTVNYTVQSGPATVIISETIPEYLTLLDTTEYPLPDGCAVSANSLTCTIIETNAGTYQNQLTVYAEVDEDIPVAGTTISNTMTVREEGQTEGSDCSEQLVVEHIDPACLFVSGGPLILRVADGAQTLTATGYLGTHSDLEFRWVATGGTLSQTAWHESSGNPYATTDGSMRVDDVVTWTPPAGANEGDEYTVTAYVRPVGDTGDGVTSAECQTTAEITALDLYCIYLAPNESFDVFPVDMTFRADIGGEAGGTFTYDLDFGDTTTHYTGSGTVAGGTTIELPYIPPQASPHTYDSQSSTTYNPILTVTNTETGEESICPTVLAIETQSSWSIVKDSNVETCAVVNSSVNYTIVVTNTGDYTASLEEVRDTIDSAINTSTVSNIQECDANGQNCTTYNRADVLSGRTITWPGRTFTAGESRRYSYTVTISSAGDHYNVAEAVPTTGAIVRDDETFPTCAAPVTGSLSSAIYPLLGAIIAGFGGFYLYQTGTGAQIIANVIGRTKREVWRIANKKESFERATIRSAKRNRKNT